MTVRAGTAVLAVLALAAAALPAAAARRARVEGRVEDADGRPVGGATVTVTAADLPDVREERTTGRKGRFKLVLRHPQLVYRYRIEKTGYRVLEREIAGRATAERRHTFVLERDPSSGAREAGADSPAAAQAAEPRSFDNV